MYNRTASGHYCVTGRWLYTWLMVVNSTSMLLFGYNQGVFADVLTSPNFEQRFGPYNNEISRGIIVGSYNLGCILGALVASIVGGQIGRRRSILLGTTIMMTGALLQLFAQDLGFMTAGRVIAGIGSGINTTTSPVWASETSTTAKRGQVGMMLMIVETAGFAISCWMTYAFSFIQSDLAWRFPLGFQLLFILIIYLAIFWLPESPRWLITKHENEKALNVLLALDGAHGGDRSLVMQDFDEIKRSIALEQAKDNWRNTKPMFRLLLGVGIQAMGQLTGISILSYYLPYVLTNYVGIAGSAARLLGAVNAITYLGSTFFGLFFIDRWGRRRLMIYGAAGQCCSWLLITVFLKAFGGAALYSLHERQLAGAAVFFFFLFNCFFGAGWHGISWLYPTEINSTRYRLPGMSFGVATNRLINFAIVFVTPLGITNLGANFYIIWTVLNALMIPIIWLFYPETAGRSLESINSMFESHSTVWAFSEKDMISRKPEEIWITMDRNSIFDDARYANIAQRPRFGASIISISPKSSRTNMTPKISKPRLVSASTDISSVRSRAPQTPERTLQRSASVSPAGVGGIGLAITTSELTLASGPLPRSRTPTPPSADHAACRGFTCLHP